LTGYPPFDADTPLAILMKHLNDPLPLPSKLDPSLPPSFEQIVLKALAKDPADRYQSATEMLAAVRNMQPSLSAEMRGMVSPPEGYAPQVVFSGDSRQQLINRQVVSDDTDPDIQPVASDEKKPPITTASPQGSVVMRLNHLIENPPSVVGAVFTGLGLILVFNMLAVMILTVTGQNIWPNGWTFELYLAAAFFTLLAWSLRSPWILNPAIIIFGNAVILSYCALTWRWQDMAFLWMFEPVILAIAILLPINLKRRVQRSAYWTRAGSLTMTILAVLLAIGTCWLSFIINLFT